MQCARSVGSEGLPLSRAGLKRLGREVLKVYRCTSRCPSRLWSRSSNLSFHGHVIHLQHRRRSEALDLALSASQAFLRQAFPYA